MTTDAGSGGLVADDVQHDMDGPLDDMLSLPEQIMLDDAGAKKQLKSKPKTYYIPSKPWGITPEEAADILITAQEIRKVNPGLLKAAYVVLLARKREIESVVR